LPWPLGSGYYHFDSSSFRPFAYAATLFAPFLPPPLSALAGRTRSIYYDFIHPEEDHRVVLYNRYLDTAVQRVLNAQLRFDDGIRHMEQSIANDISLSLFGQCFDAFEEALRAAYQQELNAALHLLGRGLHPLQDIHAHGNMGNWLFGHHVFEQWHPELKRVRQYGDFEIPYYIYVIDLVSWNILNADRPAYDWYCENMIRLVRTLSPDEYGRGQRFRDAKAHTIRYLESFLVLTGLRACNRLGEGQHVWIDPATHASGAGGASSLHTSTNASNTSSGSRGYSNHGPYAITKY